MENVMNLEGEEEEVEEVEEVEEEDAGRTEVVKSEPGKTKKQSRREGVKNNLCDQKWKDQKVGVGESSELGMP